MRVTEVMMGQDEIELRDKVAAELYVRAIIAVREIDSPTTLKVAKDCYTVANLFLEARREQQLTYKKVIP